MANNVVLVGPTAGFANSAGLDAAQFDPEFMKSAPDIFGLGDFGDGTDLAAGATGTLVMIHTLLRVPLAIVDGIHGYKRNKGDVGSTILWSALGLFFPIITTSVALYQGYGKAK